MVWAVGGTWACVAWDEWAVLGHCDHIAHGWCITTPGYPSIPSGPRPCLYSPLTTIFFGITATTSGAALCCVGDRVAICHQHECSVRTTLARLPQVNSSTFANCHSLPTNQRTKPYACLQCLLLMTCSNELSQLLVGEGIPVSTGGVMFHSAGREGWHA